MILTDGDGCASDVSATETVSFTAVIDIALDQSINIYPNPVENILTVNFSNADISNLNISMVDVAGKVVIDQPVTRSTVELNVSQFAPGAYIIRVQNKDGKMAIREIIKY